MTVRQRLVLTFVLGGGLLVIPSLYAAVRLTELREFAIQGRGDHALASLSVGRIEAGLAELDQALRGYLIDPAPPRREASFGMLQRLHQDLRSIQRAGFVEASPPLADALDSLAAHVGAIDELVQERRMREATALHAGFERSLTWARERLRTLALGIDERAEADFERARAISTTARRWTMLAVLVAVAVTVLLAGWTTRALTSPLRQLRTALARVADGDFHAPPELPYERTDEIGDLAVSFGMMARRLAELDRLKAEFMGVASHELKTPINVIKGYTELIEEELAGELTEHQREIMRRIEEQTRVLTRQVSRLMDISRLETGSYAMEPESVLVEDLVMGVGRAFEVLAHKKGVELVTELAADAPERVELDVDLVRDEVLGNLVGNALKFTPEGGRVALRVRGEAGGLLIEVADSGPGIPPEHRDHIFDKYYQVERSRAVGSGLGLAIAKEMVEAHGGWIRLAEGDAPGATFHVWLPVVVAGVPAAPERATV